jgi:cysteinyl-tRNA synthetase
MEAISGKKPMVRYWIHTGLLKINGKKMAKSLGNFITIRDFLKKYPAEVLRFIVFSSHYRSPLDYSEKIAAQAKRNLEKLEEFLKRLKEMKGRAESNDTQKAIEIFERKFFQSLEEDFNTPKAKGLLFDFVSKINKKIDKNQISGTEAREIYNFFKKINEIFLFLDFKKIKKIERVPKKIKKLVELREKYRSQRNWQKADELRKKIQTLGYKIEDTKVGPVIKKID